MAQFELLPQSDKRVLGLIPTARFDHRLALPESADLAKAINDAMRATANTSALRLYLRGGTPKQRGKIGHHTALKGQTLTIEIKTPELEALIQERLRDGGFANLDELLTKALESLPESGLAQAPSPKRAKRLVEVLTAQPFAGSGLTIERLKQYPPPTPIL